MKYQALIFDLFGTLIDNVSLKQSKDHLAAMAAILGIATQKFIAQWTVETWQMRATGLLAIEECLVHICHTWNIEIRTANIIAAKQIWLEFTANHFFLKPRALETLIDLKLRGYKLGIITDCSEEVPLLWHRLPFAHIVDISIHSCSVGLKKPDPRIYHLACDRLRVYPEDCLYIGDGCSQELTGAAAIGMHPLMIRCLSEDLADVLRPDPEEWQGPKIFALEEVFSAL
jgi:putative hydrolase of the HAD superfamily